MRLLATIRNLDPWLLVAAVFLSGAGIMNLVGNPDFFPLLVKQIGFVVVGLLLVVGIAVTDYRIFRSSFLRAASVWVVGVTLLLFTVLFGETVRGATNWLFLGPISIQPVELVKFGVLLVFAAYFARQYGRLVFVKDLVVPGLVVGVPVLITFFQPDLGAAMILTVFWFITLLVLRMSPRVLVPLLIVGGIGSVFVWNTVLYDFHKERLLSFVSAYQGSEAISYQTRQAVVAVGDGGMFGKGFFAEDLSSRLAFLPESTADFAFASLIEQAGFAGGALVLAAALLLCARIYKSAVSATNNFSYVYALSLLVLLVVEIGFHVGMNLGVFPVAGLPFPLLSYGGSHTLMTFAMLGLLESVRLHQPTFSGKDFGVVSEV